MHSIDECRNHVFKCPSVGDCTPTEAEIGLSPATRFLAQRAINTL